MFTPTALDLLYRGSSADDPRIGGLVQLSESSKINKAKAGFAILGAADDEGVKVNHGRGGASAAPKEIRRQLFRTTASRSPYPRVYDLGDLENSCDLRAKQEAYEKASLHVLKHGMRLVSIGGGNDYAFPAASAFLQVYAKDKPVVINIDAHLDLRPAINGPTSGTPFFQLVERFKKTNKVKFDLIEIGIQKHCNSLEHYRYAKINKVKVYELDEVVGRFVKIWKSLKLKQRPIFLAIDMDAFASFEAPGVSAPNALGLPASEFMNVLELGCANNNVQGIGVYEVCPPFDVDNRTARLAAKIIHTYFHFTNGNKLK